MDTNTTIIEDSKQEGRDYNVPALARGLEILSYFTPTRRELSGAQISKMSGLPRASVFRIVHTLEQAGYLVRYGEEGRHPTYRLGVAVLRLGFEYLASQEITELGRPVLESLSESCGHSSYISVLDERHIVIVAKALGRLAAFHAIQVGTRLPAHGTAPGRLLMQGMSLPEITSLYATRPMKAYTDATPTTPQSLKDHIDAAAIAGYSVSHGGFEAGLSTVAAPVYNSDKKVCAVISIAILASRINAAEQAYLVKQVCDSAEQLTWRLQQASGYKR